MGSGRLTGRVAVVTGASSGIGRSIAVKFAQEGAKVINADIRREPKSGEFFETEETIPTDEIIRNDGRSAQFIKTDVSDPTEVSDMVERTIEEFGELDILVNNAGIERLGSSQEISIEDWQEVLSINLNGTFYCSKYAIPYLQKSSGDLINISSVMATEGGNGPPYSATKAGILNLTRDLAVELGDESINVNSICPGYIKTPIQDVGTEEAIELARNQTLLPRLGKPEDVANVAVFLASNEAEFVHGSSIVVDGGWSAHRV